MVERKPHREKSLRELFPNTEWDYGDDIRDFEIKQEAKWNQELQNNPIYRPYLEQARRR